MVSDNGNIIGDDEFESIDLNFDQEVSTKTNKNEETVESIDDLDLSSMESHEEVKDDLHEEVKDKKLEPTTVIKVELPKAPVKKDAIEDIDLDLDLPDSPPVTQVTPEVKTSVVDTVKNTETPGNEISSDDLDGLDLSTDTVISPPVVKQDHDDLELVAPETVIEPVKEEPKKRGRKPKVQVENTTVESPVVQTVTTDRNISLEPLFDITKINTSKKYQTRAVERTPDQLKQFGEILTLQGQLEPIHIHHEGPEYFVVVGFGRYEALKLIGAKTIKVIIHENLSESELIKLSTGTNENRLELTEWDKIVAVGKFNREHPEVPKDSTPGTQSLSNIFGYSKTMIYNYIELYSYFIQHEEYVNFFKNEIVPHFIFKCIFEARGYIGDDVEKYVKFISDNKNLIKKDFVGSLTEFISNERIVKRIVEQENTTANIDIDLGHKDITKSEIDKMVINLSECNKQNSKDDIEKIKKVSDVLSEFSKNVSAVEDTLKNLLAIDNVKQYIDNSRINSIGKKITNLSKLYLKIA